MKYFKFVLITTLAFLPVSFTPVKTKTERLIKFTITAYSSTVMKNGIEEKEITFEKPVPILKIGEDGIQMTKVEQIIDEDNNQYDMPILDSNGKPETINFKDIKDVSRYTHFLFNNSLNMKITGHKNRLQASIITYLLGHPEIYWVYSDSYGVIHKGRNGYIETDYDTQYLQENRYSMYIMDEDLIYQVESLNDGKYVTTASKPINPDSLPENERKEMIEWRSFNSNMETGYFVTYNAGLGYLEMCLNEEFPNGQIISNGAIRGTLYPNVEMVDGKLIVDVGLVAFQLGGALELQTEENTYIFKKLEYISDYKIQLQELMFTVGSKTAYFDGKDVELIVAPYEQNESRTVMMAIDDLVKFFSVKYHYRPTNNSLLIERFQNYRN